MSLCKTKKERFYESFQIWDEKFETNVVAFFRNLTQTCLTRCMRIM